MEWKIVVLYALTGILVTYYDFFREGGMKGVKEKARSRARKSHGSLGERELDRVWYVVFWSSFVVSVLVFPIALCLVIKKEVRKEYETK